MVIAQVKSAEHVSADSAVWELLDRFGLNLRRCANAEEEIGLTLAAVAEALDADIVFWHPGDTGEPPQALGSPELTIDWRHRFLRQCAVEPSNDGVLLRHFLDPAAKPAKPWPLSAALARINETAGGWLAALRFSPRSLFASHDLNVLTLARRLLLNHQQRGLVHDQLKNVLGEKVRCLSAALEEWVRQKPGSPDERIATLLQSCRQTLDSLCRGGDR